MKFRRCFDQVKLTVNRMNTAFSKLTFAALMILPGVASAQVSAEVIGSSDVVCAAVMPCDADGAVLPAFSKGACASYYELLCIQQKANDLVSELAQCNDSNAKLIAQVKALQKKVNKLIKKQARR